MAQKPLKQRINEGDLVLGAACGMDIDRAGIESILDKHP